MNGFLNLSKVNNSIVSTRAELTLQTKACTLAYIVMIGVLRKHKGKFNNKLTFAVLITKGSRKVRQYVIVAKKTNWR